MFPNLNYYIPNIYIIFSELSKFHEDYAMLTVNDVDKFINNNILLEAQSNNLKYRSVQFYLTKYFV